MPKLVTYLDTFDGRAHTLRVEELRDSFVDRDGVPTVVYRIADDVKLKVPASRILAVDEREEVSR